MSWTKSCPWVLINLCLCAIPARGQVAPTSSSLANLDPRTFTPDSIPREFVQAGSQMFFTVDESLQPPSARKRTLWASDGTAGNARRVFDPSPATPGPSLLRLHAFGSSVLFHFGNSLWLSDGTTQNTRALTAVSPLHWPQGSEHASQVVFAGNDPMHGTELWVTDATPGGTRLLADIVPGQTGSSPASLWNATWDDGRSVRELTFFTCTTHQEGHELWAVENGRVQIVVDLDPGTGSGIDSILAPAFYVDPRTHEFHMAFAGTTPATGREVFLVSRLPQDPWFTLRTTPEVAPGPSDSLPQWLVTRDAELVFQARTNPLSSSRLWAMDFRSRSLTPLGTSLFSPSQLIIGPNWNAGQDETVYFNASSAAVGTELWAYDGQGTHLVLDIEPAGTSFPADFVLLGNELWFTATTSAEGKEIWKTDGSSAGTRLAHAIIPGTASAEPSLLTPFETIRRESLFLSAVPSSTVGREPYLVSNGTGSILLDIFPQLGLSSEPESLGSLVDGRIVFRARGIDPGVWISDGTTGGTSRVLGGNFAFGPFHAFTDGSFLVFTSDNVAFPNAGQWTLHHYQGTTPLHTVLLPRSTHANVTRWPGDPVMFKESFYFTYQTPLSDDQIFTYDRQGNVLPVLGQGWTAGWHPVHLTAVGSRLFFQATDSTGSELWVWNGSSPPFRVADINPSGNSSPTHLTAFNNRCFFIAFDDPHGWELWSSNGIGSGTSMVTEIRPGPGISIRGPLVSTGPALLFSADDGTHGMELWRTNGYPSGTVLTADLNPGPASSNPREITAVHVDRVACVADDGTHGEELFLVGVTGNTTLHDLRPGPESSWPRDLMWSSRHLLFSADDGQHGREPWYADWIDFSTVAMLHDVAPGADTSSPRDFTAFADKAFFAADDHGILGEEPWVAELHSASYPVGSACSAPDNHLDLRSTAPVISGNYTYWCYEPGPPSTAVVYISLPPVVPVPAFVFGCELQLDPNVMIQFDVFQTAGGYVRTLGIPADPNLAGGRLRFQVLHLDLALPQPTFYVTNALDLRFG